MQPTNQPDARAPRSATSTPGTLHITRADGATRTVPVTIVHSRGITPPDTVIHHCATGRCPS